MRLENPAGRCVAADPRQSRCSRILPRPHYTAISFLLRTQETRNGSPYLSENAPHKRAGSRGHLYGPCSPHTEKQIFVPARVLLEGDFSICLLASQDRARPSLKLKRLEYLVPAFQSRPTPSCPVRARSP